MTITNKLSLHVPVYRMPSELRQGDLATSSGIVNGNFFKASLSDAPKTYKDPSLGSGRNIGLKKEIKL